MTHPCFTPVLKSIESGYLVWERMEKIVWIHNHFFFARVSVCDYNNESMAGTVDLSGIVYKMLKVNVFSLVTAVNSVETGIGKSEFCTVQNMRGKHHEYIPLSQQHYNHILFKSNNEDMIYNDWKNTPSPEDH